LKKLSIILGSAVGVLLVFSVISYAQKYMPQDPKPAVKQAPVLEVAGQIPEDETTPTAEAPTTAPAPAPAAKLIDVIEKPTETYSATAYSLRGRTASGQYVSRGLIAADPRHLPLGTRVRLDAGQWSGEYLVADTGGAIKGRKIDIWTPSTREALQFGRRSVKLTVLSVPVRRPKMSATRARMVTPPAAMATAEKQEK
jgi:3D (Asp-Asp-Asp) domain-containing protein